MFHTHMAYYRKVYSFHTLTLWILNHILRPFKNRSSRNKKQQQLYIMLQMLICLNYFITMTTYHENQCEIKSILMQLYLNREVQEPCTQKGLARISNSLRMKTRLERIHILCTPAA